MSSRWTRRAVLPLLVLTAASCSDSGTGSNLTDMVLDFCSGADTPVFIALQNEGQNWERITPDANGTIAFRATNKVGLAFVYQINTAFFTDILYTTRDELQPLANAACPELFGTKILNGSVASVSGTAAAEITVAGDNVSVQPPPSTFTLSGLPSGPIDLLASRNDFVLGVYAPNRVIVRRNVNLTTGATIPALDFAASEAVVPAQNSLAISGFSTSDNTQVFEDFSTVTTTHALWSESQISSNTLTIYGFPSSLTQVGDLHILTVRAFSNTGNSYRVSEQYYRDPANRTAGLGTALNAPTVTTIASTPYLRLSASLPSQADYSSFASVRHSQGARTVSVTATSGYFGVTPGTWVLDIPDLSGVSGFSSSSYALQAGSAQSDVEAYSGTLSEFFGVFDEGGNLKLAGRLAGTGLAQASVAPGGPPEGRSRFAGRRVTFGAR
jgi:hypothetical protein